MTLEDDRLMATTKHDLDEDAIRESSILDMMQRIERAGNRMADAAQKHGAALTASREEWAEAERKARAAKLEFAMTCRDARTTLLAAIHDAVVVHDIELEQAVVKAGHP